jgi:thymidylate synthase (FAD)
MEGFEACEEVMKIVKPSVTLVHATPDPERVIEKMGRICYQSSHKTKPCEECKGVGTRERWHEVEPQCPSCDMCDGTGTDIESARDFIRMILRRGHESVIEHASAGFMIVTDRGVTHEQVRHRLASPSQESTRFCNYSKDAFGHEISVIEPPWVGTEDDRVLAESIWGRLVGMVEAGYFDLLEKAHQPPELARSVLQNCLKSQIGVSANFREWRLILRQRTSPKAHPQMREIAEMIRTELLKISKVCFEDIP